MSESVDRLLPVCELLLGAAYADAEFHQREKTTIVSLLKKLLGDDQLPAPVKASIDHFDPSTFDVAATCSEFTEWPGLTKKNLLELIGAVHDADAVFDFAEDEYIRSVADALKVSHASLGDLALTYEVNELKAKLSSVAKPPPLPQSVQ